MKISAVVCTHNRPHTLRMTIESLIRQSLRREDYEIIIVDNSSTDATRQVVGEFRALSNLKYVYEPRLGLSHARNTGWKASGGEFVAYIDDDAIASPNWLERILRAFETIPQAGAVGGKVIPIWEEEPPVWINPWICRFLSIVNWSDSPMILDDSRFLAGVNMGIRKDCLKKFSGFNPNLGRIGNVLLSNEEVDFIDKVKSDRMVVYYDPEIVVQHLIPSERLQPKWFRKRWFNQGVSDAVLYIQKENPPGRERVRQALTKLWNVLKRPRKLYHAFFPSRYPEYISESYNSIIQLGFIYGLFRMRRNPEHH